MISFFLVYVMHRPEGLMDQSGFSENPSGRFDQ